MPIIETETVRIEEPHRVILKHYSPNCGEYSEIEIHLSSPDVFLPIKSIDIVSRPVFFWEY